ncbi:MAG: methylmalonyl-CoA mutase [Deltaproteobacteria bacterium]|nr:methylmalonyl-CoA mutase [Deltaproteobacteria bacterium]
MNDKGRDHDLQEFYRTAGADSQGRLKDDEGHCLSTGEDMPFLFTEGDTAHGDGELPGRPTYRRGVYPTMYRGRFWTMRQYAGFGTAEATNRRFRYLLEQGQTGLSTAFDLPTQMGLDSDHALAVGEVGRVGVAIDTVDDLDRVFENIPLDQVSVSMTINATAPILLAMLQVVAEERGLDPSVLKGTTQNDILKEYVARGTYIYPPRPSLDLAADLIAYCSKRLPKWNPISISGYHIREAGSDSVQEVGFTLADGLAYVQAAVDRGFDVDRFAPRLSFFFGCHNHLLEEVAKFRAARVAWATLMKERMGAKDPRSMALRFHTQTAGCSLTAQQPENNVVRVTLQALAAVLGGTQSLHTNAQDEALSLPTEDTARVALRTQQIIAHESHVTDFVDPLGGSYVVEAMTDRIVQSALDLVDQVDGLGGMVAAIEKGFVQNRIEETAYRHQQDLEAGRARVVGMNCFTGEEPRGATDPEDDEAGSLVELEASQIARLGQFRKDRNETEAQAAIDGVREAAREGVGVVEAVVEAVRRRATVGEVSGAIEDVFGRFGPA